MKRPGRLTTRVLLVILGLVIAQYAVLAWVVPRSVMRAVERAAGGRFVIGNVSLRFPLTTTLTALRLAGNSEAFAFSVQRVTVKPRWCWLPTRTVWLETLEFERPFLRLSRTQAGTIVWPTVRLLAGPETGAPEAPEAEAASAAPEPWTIHVGSIKVTDGVVEFVDHKTARPFHGALDHLSMDLGPVTARPGTLLAPPSLEGGLGTSFAARGQALGDQGHGAPLYCSGWTDPAAKDLQASCQLEPLALAAFEPYFAGPPEVRVYSATLKMTSQWSARANQFTGRVQLELNQLAEGDLSIRGRPLIDVKRLTDSQEPRLTGEVRLFGSLNDPRGWHAEFLPGDERVQQLVKRLLDRGVELIRLTLWGRQLPLALAPSSQARMTDIEAASREVQEALEILAGPPPEEPPPTAPTDAAPETPPAEPAPMGRYSTPPPAPEPPPAEPAPSPPAPPAAVEEPVSPQPPAPPPDVTPAEPPVPATR